MAAVDPVLAAWAEEVGPREPVVPVGARTQWDVGGSPSPDAREVTAPSGILEYEPAEMIVRCRAGTTVAEVDAALAHHRQMVPLDPARPEATVGGVLAVGYSGMRRLRYGPVRDTLLQARFVNAAGRVVTAGGAVVKNVSGFDLCRLMVGSLGTLGLLAEVVLRAQPRPPSASWWRGGAPDPLALRNRLFRPSTILWDGTDAWVLLEGGHADVEAERRQLGAGFVEVDGPPPLPDGGRLSLRPAAIAAIAELGGQGSFVAEIGVGTVHVDRPVPRARVHPSAARLHGGIKAAFDPTGRLNPGRGVA
jgi:glycolate oxidase FAD binding subunit